MKLKRILFFSGIILVVCILTALTILLFAKRPVIAGKSNDTTAAVTPISENSPTPEKTSAASPETSNMITIKLGIWPKESQADEIKLFEGYNAKMKELHPNVQIEPVYFRPPTDYDLKTAAQAGTLPTIFYFGGYYGAKNNLFGSVFGDITDELAARGWDKAINPVFLNVISKDGRIYQFPRYGDCLGLMMNVGLFEQAGLVDAKGYPVYPMTMDELAETARKIKDATGKAGICIAGRNVGGWHFEQIAWNFGATLCILNEDGTATANLNSPEAIAAMNFIKDLKWKYDVLTDHPELEDWTTGFTRLANGEAAMYIGAGSSIGQVTQVNGLPLDKLAMCPVPAGPNGNGYCTVSGGFYAFAYNASHDEINACLDYLDIMGQTPAVSEEMKTSAAKYAQYKADNNIPVIPDFPCWINKDYLDAQTAITSKYSNVDPGMFRYFIEATADSSNRLRYEEGYTDREYVILSYVIRQVVTDKNADVAALMNTANEDFNTFLKTGHLGDFYWNGF